MTSHKIRQFISRSERPAFLLIAFLSALPLANGAAVTATKFWTFVSGSAGITALQLDTTTGSLKSFGSVYDSPTNYLWVAPDQTFLCGVGDTTEPATKKKLPIVFSASIDGATGKLTPIDHTATQGSCYVTIDAAAKNAIVANYSAATLEVFPLDSTGKFGPRTSLIQQTGSSIDPKRQDHAYAHSVNLDPTGKFAFSADLGADKLFSYKFDVSAGTLTPNDPPSISTPPGSGPRHFTFDRAGKFCYLLTEMGGTVIVYRYDAAAGSMKQIQICPLLPPDYKGENTSAEVQIDPRGRFLYASNRLTSDMMTILSIDPSSGKLTPVGYQPTGGKTPRNFRIDPTGNFLIAANQDSDNIVLFRIDAATGQLSPVGEPIAIKHPQCVKFVAQ